VVAQDEEASKIIMQYFYVNYHFLFIIDDIKKDCNGIKVLRTIFRARFTK